MVDAYWDNFGKNKYKEELGLFINQDKPREVTEKIGHPVVAKEEIIEAMLEFGVDLGIEREGRWPLEGPNNGKVYEYGQRVADSLQTGLRDGILYGPMKRDELPWSASNAPP